MNHRGSLGTNVYSPISQSPITPPISPPPQFCVRANAKPIDQFNDDDDDDDGRPSSSTNDPDRNALVEFNRKKAQLEMFQ